MLKTKMPSLLKGRLLRSKPKLRWEHVAISFLLGALVLNHSSGHIVHAVPISPAPAIISIKPLPKLKEASYVLQTPLEPIWVSKLRPWGTYANGFAVGWCTWGVASRLPVDWSGDARDWAYNASMAGHTVSNVPSVEAIAQTSGDSYLGHVAIVIALNPDGSFVIWEENGMYGLGTTDERTTTTAEFPNFIKI